MTNRDPSVTEAALADIRHLEQYTGLWAMEEAAFRGLLDQVREMDLVAHLAAAGRRDAALFNPPRSPLEQRGEADYASPSSLGKVDGALAATIDETLDFAASNETPYAVVPGGVAVMPLVGTITKYGSSLSTFPGTLTMRRRLRLAVADDRVRAVLLRIDSPGGTSAGTADLALEVARTAQSKPVIGYIEDLGASAAYWVAAQTTHLLGNTTAKAGSIGTFMVVQDISEALRRDGITMHVIKAGLFKGIGVPGTPLEAVQREELQRTVNLLNDQFVEAVAVGRGLDQDAARRLADGRIHVGAEAVAVGLLDGVMSYAEAIDAAATAANGPRGRLPVRLRLSASSTETDAPAALPAGRLVAAEPGAFGSEHLRDGERMMSTKDQGTAVVTDGPRRQSAATAPELRTLMPEADREFLFDCLEKSLTGDQAVQAYNAYLIAENKALRDQLKENAKARETLKADQTAKAKQTAKAVRRPGHDPARFVTEAPDVDPAAGDAARAGANGDQEAVIQAFGAAVEQQMGLYQCRHSDAVQRVIREQPDLHAAYVAAYNTRHAARRRTG